MQYTAAGNNPFGGLTSIVAPAILTNDLFGPGTGDQQPPGASCGSNTRRGGRTCGIRARDLELQRQFHATGSLAGAQLLLRALRLFYASIGLFAAAALVSVIGSIVTYDGRHVLFQLAAGLALGI